jgi:hypothetical protein
MSNAWLNVRFGTYYVIVGERWLFGLRTGHNYIHRDNPVRFQVRTLKLFGYRIR